MPFARGDMRGPHRLTQKRPQSFVRALRSIAVVESAKISFCEIFGVVQFSTFAALSPRKRMIQSCSLYLISNLIR
jgi:hypothetical protein